MNATPADMEVLLKVESSLLELDLTLQDGSDKIRSIEWDVSRRVEISTLLASEGKLELALMEAEAAVKHLDSLKLAIHRDQRQRSATNTSLDTTGRSASQSDTNQPMTTAVNVFDLSIMVKCNLATQLKNNGQLESALELYTQLCKLAIEQIGGGGVVSSSSFISDSNGSNQHQQQQQQSRYLLHRFGLNIGNILFEMKEYQRALKYYRLTLDRLSSVSGHRNLQIKLMNNITVALMAMNGVLAGDGREPPAQVHRAQRALGPLASLSKTNDHVTSLQLLLSDNSIETAIAVTKQQQQTMIRKSATTGSGGSGSDHDGRQSATTKQALNSNHHRFGLNMIVSQYENLDLSSLYSTLKSLVQVDGCGFQYKRVLAFDRYQVSDGDTIKRLPRDELFENVGRRFHNKSAHATTDRLSSNSQDNRGRRMSSGGGANLGSSYRLRSQPTNNDEHDKITSEEEDDTPNKRWNNIHGDLHASNAGDAAPDQAIPAAERQFRQVMSIARVDELESLICAKEREIHRTLITSCNLAIDLDRRVRRERRREHQRNHAKQRQNYHPSGSRPLNLLEQEHRRDFKGNKRGDDNEGGTKRADRGPPGLAVKATSALSQCVKLVATSDLYKGLTEDLLANGVSRLLSRRARLSEALYVFERIDLDQQVGTAASNAVANVVSKPSKSQRAACMDQLSCKQDFMVGGDCKSALVATNLGLLYLLRDRIKFSLGLNERALQLDESNAESLVNMANCHLRLNELQKAEHFYATAAKVKPTFWMTHFNRMLASVKIKRHLDDVDEDLTSQISRELDSYKSTGLSLGRYASFSWFRMALLQLKLAQMYKQSGIVQRYGAILTEILVQGGIASPPELSLAVSKASEISHGMSRDASTQKVSPAIAVLQQASSVHPYHIPTAERLIALHISSFDYKGAISILKDCIINRLDQVKWYQMLAECHRRSANYNEAIMIYKHAIEIFPMDRSCLKSLAKLTDELGLDEERAFCEARLQQLSQAREIAPL